MTKRKEHQIEQAAGNDAAANRDAADISRRRFLKGATAVTAATLAAASLSPGSAVADEGITATGHSARWLSSSRIEVERGVHVHLSDWGEGKPIVLVHGWPSSHLIFERQMLGLAERGYRVIGFDQRGFGQSDKPWHGNDYDTWASDLGSVIDTLGLRDVVLAGYSMGGAIAAHYVATHRRSRVSKLALLGAAAPYLTWTEDNPAGLPPEMFAAMLEGIRSDRAGFFHDFMPGMFHSPVSDAYVRWFEGVLAQASLRATVRGLEEGRDRDLRPEFTSITLPTLIVHGVHDYVAPFSLAEEQHRLIEGSRLVPFEESGHGLFADEADRLTEVLAEFAG